MSFPYIYGIDFGTSNSALAILDVNTNEVVKIFTTPSLLFFPEMQNALEEPQYFVGKEAVEGYVNSRMKGRFMKSIKKVLPNKIFQSTRIHNKNYTAEELVSLIILHLKRQADAFLGMDIKTAVMGRPVVFDEDASKDAIAQKRLGNAAKLAGLETIFFQLEPIGAAFSYERQLTKSELVLVADFGGGTSDFTLMRLNPAATGQSDRKEDMIAQGGIYIGGDNFDSAIMWEKGTPHFGRGLDYQSIPNKWLAIPISFFLNICSWEKLNFFDSNKIKNDIKNYYNWSGKKPQLKNLMSLIEHNLGYNIFKVIENVKMELSRSENVTFAFHQEDIDFEEIITIENFEKGIIKNDLDKIDVYLSEFLEKHSYQNTQIESVFMTGGTSLVKPLQNRFMERFGAEKLKSGDNFNSVAIGLAYSYALFK